jgi:hypothetical protein
MGVAVTKAEKGERWLLSPSSEGKKIELRRGGIRR